MNIQIDNNSCQPMSIDITSGGGNLNINPHTIMELSINNNARLIFKNNMIESIADVPRPTIKRVTESSHLNGQCPVYRNKMTLKS